MPFNKCAPFRCLPAFLQCPLDSGLTNSHPFAGYSPDPKIRQPLFTYKVHSFLASSSHDMDLHTPWAPNSGKVWLQCSIHRSIPSPNRPMASHVDLADSSMIWPTNLRGQRVIRDTVVVLAAALCCYSCGQLFIPLPVTFALLMSDFFPPTVLSSFS
jgi:hypothetical protein